MNANTVRAITTVAYLSAFIALVLTDHYWWALILLLVM
jgi:hypothetical protein